MGQLSMVIIPGASAVPKFPQTVVNAVTSHGIDITALHIPSVGLEVGDRPGEPPTMYDDAAFIANHVTSLADSGKDVILVTHSYGGTLGTESVRGLSKQERHT